MIEMPKILGLRYTRVLLAACALLVFISYLRFVSPRLQAPLLTITPSSYDWARFQPFHRPENIIPLPTGTPSKSRIQATKFETSNNVLQAQRREAIKRDFLRGWQNYKKRAWLRDELQPITGNPIDTFGGWAATLVDSLGTLWIMELHEEFAEAARAAVTINWANTTSTSCNMFETTIRHLGGLLSAYDLSKQPALLHKAVELGDMLYAGFDTPNRMPGFWLDFNNAKTGHLQADDWQPLTSHASLTMEFARLGLLTGDARYYDAVAKVSEKLFEHQNGTLLPGMWPAMMNVRQGDWTRDNFFTLGALSDSAHEYIVKMQLLLGGKEPKYHQMTEPMLNTIRDNLLFRPMTPNKTDILFPGDLRVKEGGMHELNSESQHLACFAGGMYALGSKLHSKPDFLDIAAQLTRGCVWAYDSMPQGLAPEIFKLVACDNKTKCDWDQSLWETRVSQDPEGSLSLPKGFQNAREPKYILRPEALESVFYMYRTTGQEEWREHAWRMYQAIDAATSTPFGNAAVKNVTVTHDLENVDSMESFWFAETLKYLYLIFSSPNLISLDDYVFNTEAHPLLIPK